MFRFTSQALFLFLYLNAEVEAFFTPAIPVRSPVNPTFLKKNGLSTKLFGIVIDIVAGPTSDESSVKASGSSQELITDDQRNSFKLNDSQLKKAVKAYFGKSPNDAFLKSPTPWGDLYKTYGWPQVNTVMVPTSAQITGITSEPVTLATKIFENNSSKTATFSGSITDQVTQGTESSWSMSEAIKFGQKFKYEVGFLGTGGGGETSLEYAHTFGQGGKESVSTTVGTASGISVTLGPHEKVKAVLTASRGTMKVRLRFKAFLRGTTAVNYNPKYKDHHFWGLNVASVMASGGVSNSITSTEDIEIGYYTDALVKLVDMDSNKELRLFRVGEDESVPVAESERLLSLA